MLAGLTSRRAAERTSEQKNFVKTRHVIVSSPGLHRPFKALPAFDPASSPVRQRGRCVSQRGRQSMTATRGPGVKVCQHTAHLDTQGIARPSDGQMQTGHHEFSVGAFVGQK